MLHCQHESFGFRTVSVIGFQQVYGELPQRIVGGRLHLVGDDNDVIQLRGILLPEKTLHGIHDYPVFPVSRKEYREAVLFPCCRILRRAVKARSDGIKQQVGHAECQWHK